MKRNHEKNILRSLFIIGILALIQLLRKPPIKDWLIIFLLKGYIASFLDNFFVKKGYIKYPIKLFKTFDISVLFSYLIFPVSCIYYNQVTRHSGLVSILLKSLLFTAPSAAVEYWLERNTNLITYKRNWTILHSFTSIASTFILVRLLMKGIRKISQKQE